MNVFFIICVLAIVILNLMVVDHYRMKKLATERGDPNICEYARAFDYRNIDTKIMREVWNELQLNLGNYNGKAFPVNADDMFEETYHMCLDDIDDIYWAIADRLGIDTEKAENNPYFNKVISVKDLVLFLHNQPRLDNA